MGASCAKHSTSTGSCEETEGHAELNNWEIDAPSDTEAEDVIVTGSAVELQASHRTGTKRRHSSSPPDWFLKFCDEMRQNR